MPKIPKHKRNVHHVWVMDRCWYKLFCWMVKDMVLKWMNATGSLSVPNPTISPSVYMSRICNVVCDICIWLCPYDNATNIYNLQYGIKFGRSIFSRLLRLRSHDLKAKVKWHCFKRLNTNYSKEQPKKKKQSKNRNKQTWIVIK